jgi:hypothetical protein
MLGTGWSNEEISRDLADKMDRREGAIERKALRPKRRTTVVNPPRLETSNPSKALSYRSHSRNPNPEKRISAAS